MEVLACTVLEYILNHHPDSRDGLNDLLARIVPGMRLSGMDFETEASHQELGRLDVLQRGNDGEGRFIIEAKCDAPLQSTQPVAYLERMPAPGVSVLMFLVPSLRVEELWPRLLGRLDRKGLPYTDLKHPRCVRTDEPEEPFVAVPARPEEKTHHIFFARQTLTNRFLMARPCGHSCIDMCWAFSEKVFDVALLA